MLNIITLMENSPSEHKALLNKHGLSFFIRYDGHTVLFDCGPDDTFLKNAHRLGVDLHKTDCVVLSHAHYDHAAGFRDFVEAGYRCKRLYTGDGFFEEKFAASNDFHLTNLGCGFDEAFLQERQIPRTVCKDTVKIADGIYVVSRFKRTHPLEKIPSRFVRKTADGFRKDDFRDEVALVLETQKGLAVIVGCSHPGILNMLSCIHETFRKPIYAVFGGTHLMEADTERIETSVREMQEMGVQIFGLCHCSGKEAECCIGAHPEITGSHLAVGDEVYLD